ncbi:MAG: hypothetical protein MUO19_09045, partial [Dehalococcoidales bacterium]|nr:hypothetical protein [Dehalococcoidales bacterium]
MLKTRLLTALWGIPLVIAAVWFDEPLPWFAILVIAIGVLAVNVLFTMTGVRTVLPLAALGMT